MAEITVFTDLAYGGHERQRIDLFRPAGEGAAPLLVLIHGGGWAGGDRVQYYQTCVRLAEAGMAAASVGYRLLPEAAWPQIAWDPLRAAAWLAERASELGIDASRTVTWGSSAGAHLALCLQAWRDRWVADGAVAAAPEIIGTLAQCPAVEFPRPVPESLNRRALMNGHPHEEVSPAHIDPRLFRSVLLVQGDGDQTTPLPAARAFVERLAGAGAEARLEVLAGAEHGFGYNLTGENARACLRLGIDYVRGLFGRGRT